MLFSNARFQGKPWVLRLPTSYTGELSNLFAELTGEGLPIYSAAEFRLFRPSRCSPPCTQPICTGGRRGSYPTPSAMRRPTCPRAGPS